MNIKSIQEIENEIYDEFTIYSSWSEKYEYLVELGRGLNKLKPQDKIEKNKLSNCTSRVWIISHLDSDGNIYFEAESDSLIIAGLLALVIKIYNGQTPQTVLQSQLIVFDRIGISANLTATRANGLNLILTRIKDICSNSV